VGSLKNVLDFHEYFLISPPLALKLRTVLDLLHFLIIPSRVANYKVKKTPGLATMISMLT